MTHAILAPHMHLCFFIMITIYTKYDTLRRKCERCWRNSRAGFFELRRGYFCYGEMEYRCKLFKIQRKTLILLKYTERVLRNSFCKFCTRRKATPFNTVSVWFI